MPIRTKRLAHGHVITPNAIVFLGVVPTDRTWLIKSVMLYNATGQFVNVLLGADDWSGDSRTYQFVAIEPGRSIRWEMFWALPEDARPWLFVTPALGAPDVSYDLSGAELLGVA